MPTRGHGLGVALAGLPQPGPGRLVGGHRAGGHLGAGVEGGGDLVDQHAGRGLRPGPGLDDHRHRRPPGAGEAPRPGPPPPGRSRRRSRPRPPRARAAAAQPAHEATASSSEPEPQREGDPLDRPGHERQQHAGDDAQGALAADQQAGEVVAGGVLGQAGEAPHDAAVGQHGLEPGHPGPHRAVAHHVDAAGVGGDHPADRGAAPGGQVDAHLEAGGPHRGLGRLQRHARAHQHLAGLAVDRAHAGQPARSTARPAAGPPGSPGRGTPPPTRPVFPPCGTSAAPASPHRPARPPPPPRPSRGPRHGAGLAVPAAGPVDLVGGAPVGVDRARGRPRPTSTRGAVSSSGLVVHRTRLPPAKRRRPAAGAA